MVYRYYNDIFLGREIGRHQAFSSRTAALIDEEVKKIVMTQYKRSRALIETNLAALIGLPRNCSR